WFDRLPPARSARLLPVSARLRFSYRSRWGLRGRHEAKDDRADSDAEQKYREQHCLSPLTRRAQRIARAVWGAHAGCLCLAITCTSVPELVPGAAPEAPPTWRLQFLPAYARPCPPDLPGPGRPCCARKVTACHFSHRPLVCLQEYRWAWSRAWRQARGAANSLPRRCRGEAPRAGRLSDPRCVRSAVNGESLCRRDGLRSEQPRNPCPSR